MADKLLRPAILDIQRRMEALGLKQKDLADHLGLDAPKISNVFTGKRDLKGEEMLKTIDWLKDAEARRASRSDHIPTLQVDGGETVDVQALDLSFSMGPGTEIDDYIEEAAIRVDLGFLRQITRSPPDRLRIARGIGDSMFPTLLSSDRVLIDTTQRVLNLNDRIYAISLYGAAAIKRLRTIGPNRVLVISDNPNVPDQEVEGEDLVIAGRVIRLVDREL